MGPGALTTPAWLMKGMTGSEAGILQMEGDRISFVTDSGAVFDAPVAEVRNVTFPWYYFGGGMQLTAGDQRHRLSFVRPNGAMDTPAHLVEQLQYAASPGTGAEVLDVPRGRAAGRAWREALCSR